MIIRIFLILILIATAANAEIYKYVGDDGEVIFTDIPPQKKFEKTATKAEKESVIHKAVYKKSEPSKAVNKKQYNSHKEDFRHIIDKKSKEHEIDASLIAAVIRAESNGNRFAVSKKGAMGLMQLMPMTAYELRVRDPFDPEDNIDGGVRYLRYLLERFKGDLTLALAAYNAGPTVVERHGNVPPITETKQYVKKVLSMYNGNSTSFSANNIKSNEQIYKIVLEDGSILFTNCSLTKRNADYIKF